MPYFSYSQIQIGPITFYTWGALLGLAFLIGSYLILREARKQGTEERKVFWLIFSIFLGSIIGARLAYILQSPEYYFLNPLDIFRVWAGGMVFYGGFLGALLASWLYIKKAKLNFSQIADLVVPALALGIFIVRIGCSLINDHQGALTNLPWAIEWSDGTLRHPVAEYLALNGLIMFLFFWHLKNCLKKSGQLFIIFLFWYSISRFFLDFTRATGTALADPHYWGLTISQWISLLILVGLSFCLLRRKQARKEV